MPSPHRALGFGGVEPEIQPEYTIQRVEPNDQQATKYLDALQGANSYALGFLTHQALNEHVQNRHVLLAFENSCPCGYLIHGRFADTTRILQTCVANDARRIQHATALVEGLTTLANNQRVHRISLHCAEDLDANQFWRSIGFTQVGMRLKNKSGRRWQLRHEISLPGERIAAMIRADRLRQAGIKRLHDLLSKGDARIANVDFAKHRAANHSFELS